jgi:hypothetical protein
VTEPVTRSGEALAVEETPVRETKNLTRARKAIQRMYEDPAKGLHHPPRRRKTDRGKRPILHPNVIQQG